MAPFLAMLRNPIVLLSGMVFMLLWYYYHQLMSTYRDLLETRRQLQRQERDQWEVWEEYESWRQKHRPDLSSIDSTEVAEFQLRKELLGALLVEMKKQGEDPLLQTWHKTLSERDEKRLHNETDLSSLEHKYQQLISTFPTSVLANLLNLPTEEGK